MAKYSYICKNFDTKSIVSHDSILFIRTCSLYFFGCISVKILFLTMLVIVSCKVCLHVVAQKVMIFKINCNRGYD